MTNIRRIPMARRRSVAVAAGLAVLALAEPAAAFDLQTGNPDLAASLSTTLRYNVGVRARKQDQVLLRNVNTDDGDSSYKRGDVVTNRIDVLSELDLNYRRMVGFKLSGAAWYDAAYHDDVRHNTSLSALSAYAGDRFTNSVRRYYRGSGEFLDAYAYGSFDLGPTRLSVKAGNTAVLWGEAIALSQHSVSYAQAPTDVRKVLATPGVDAKETALPVGQVALDWQVLPELIVLGQYFYDWKPSRLPEAGTYLAAVDLGFTGPTQAVLSPVAAVPFRGYDKPKSTSGDYGVGMRWTPEALGGTVGVYYRKFTDRSGWGVVRPGARDARFRYAEGAHLFGASLSKNIGGVSAGLEVVKRTNTAFSTGVVIAPPSEPAAEGPRGNTTHVLLNGLKSFGPNSLWDSSSLIFELAYSRRDRLKSDPYKAFRTCESDTSPTRTGNPANGCITRDNWVALVRFNPSWVAVSPGWDLSGAAVLSYGIKGNSSVIGGGSEGVGSWSLGGTLTYNAAHEFTLAYNGYLNKNALASSTNPASTAWAAPPLHDRGWVSFTYKTAF